MAKGKSSTSASTGAATDGVTRVEIVTRGEVRRSYTPEKARLLTEAAEPGARVRLAEPRLPVAASGGGPCGATDAATSAGLRAPPGGRWHPAGRPRPAVAGEASCAGRFG